MAGGETEGGVTYDPLTMDLVECHFWRDIWEAIPAEIAFERGIELRDFGYRNILRAGFEEAYLRPNWLKSG
jgi:hypothetical protein